MRRTIYNQPVARPGDTLESVQREAGFGTPIAADLCAEPSARFRWGGVMVDTNGHQLRFDGFSTKEAARTWLVESIGLREGVINDLDQD